MLVILKNQKIANPREIPVIKTRWGEGEETRDYSGMLKDDQSLGVCLRH